MSDETKPLQQAYREAAMTHQEKAIKIAEVCGWTGIEPGACSELIGFHGNPEPGERREMIPDFMSSLDACAEMRKALTTVEQQEDYGMNLLLVVPCETDYEGLSRLGRWQYLNATPEQHCEAFGRTLGLWT